jgi:hypothetical protein
MEVNQLFKESHDVNMIDHLLNQDGGKITYIYH